MGNSNRHGRATVATLTARDLDDDLVRALCIRAAEHAARKQSTGRFLRQAAGAGGGGRTPR
jgi:plasmid stability protein